MKHALPILFSGIALLVVSAASIWPDLSLFFASDTCMASGGSFDFSQLRCDFRRSHAYATFEVWPFWLAFAGGGLGLALMGRGIAAARLR